jgi:hypothetical protein
LKPGNSASVNAAANDDGTTNDRHRGATNANGAVRSRATRAIDAARANHRIGLFDRHGHRSNNQAKGQSELHQRFHGDLPVLRREAPFASFAAQSAFCQFRGAKRLLPVSRRKAPFASFAAQAPFASFAAQAPFASFAAQAPFASFAAQAPFASSSCVSNYRRPPD